MLLELPSGSHFLLLTRWAAISILVLNQKPGPFKGGSKLAVEVSFLKAVLSSSDTAECDRPDTGHSAVVSLDFKAGNFGIRLLRNCSLEGS